MAQIENKQYLGSNFYTLSLLFLIFSVFNYSQEVKQIEIVYAGSFDRNEKIYPEGNILFQWDGRTKSGKLASSGQYFIVVEGDNFQRWINTTMLK